MNRCMIGGLLAVLCVLRGESLIWPPTANRKPTKKIAPAAVRSYAGTFKAEKRAVAIVQGEGRTCMVVRFRRHGNCVARMIWTSPKTCDDLAVEWVPASTSHTAWKFTCW